MARLDMVELRAGLIPGQGTIFEIKVPGKHPEICRVPIDGSVEIKVIGSTQVVSEPDGNSYTWWRFHSNPPEQGWNLARSFARDNNPFQPVRRILGWER